MSESRVSSGEAPSAGSGNESDIPTSIVLITPSFWSRPEVAVASTAVLVSEPDTQELLDGDGSLLPSDKQSGARFGVYYDDEDRLLLGVELVAYGREDHTLRNLLGFCIRPDVGTLLSLGSLADLGKEGQETSLFLAIADSEDPAVSIRSGEYGPVRTPTDQERSEMQSALEGSRPFAPLTEAQETALIERESKRPTLKQKLEMAKTEDMVILQADEMAKVIEGIRAAPASHFYVL